MDKRKLRKGKKLYKVIDNITSVLMIPFVVIMLILCLSMFDARSKNQVPSMFGYSVVEVQSDSMKASGFVKGDTAVIQEQNINSLEVGDIIAFYSYIDSKYSKPNGATESINEGSVLSYNNGKIPVYASVSYANSQEKAAKCGSPIYFHEIVEIIVEEDNGTVWFRTKGSSNEKADPFLIREDFVIGSHYETSSFLTTLLAFVTSTSGIVWLVIVPWGILFTLSMIPWWEYISLFAYERKLVKGKMKIDDKDIQENDVLVGMKYKNKLFVMGMIVNETTIEKRQDYFEEMFEKTYVEIKNSTRKKKVKIAQDFAPYLDNESAVYEEDYYEEEAFALATLEETTSLLKSFVAKLSQSRNEVKEYYGTLKNKLMSYKKVKNRISFSYERFNIGRKSLAKLSIRGKTLCLYVALDSEMFNDTKYKVEQVVSKKYSQTPTMFRIKCNLHEKRRWRL